MVLQPNEWETAFFGRCIGSLIIDAAGLAARSPQERDEAVAAEVTAADAAGYALLQARLDVRALDLAASFEQAGFRLVETRIEFLTRLDRRTAPRHASPFGSTALAGPEHREALLALVDEGLTHNPDFHSRYKNPAYFSPEETARWFAAWVDNDLADPETRVAIWLAPEGPIAFFGLARSGEHGALPLYKSTLAVAAAPSRGHKAHIFLQTVLFDALPHDEFFMRSVTQMTNGPVIRNNIALGRRLDRIELVFFRAGAGATR